MRASVEDADRINEWIWRDSGKRHPQLEALLLDDMNVCLIEGGGGAIFVWRGPGIFETHLFLEQRGKAAFAVMREMFRTMKEQHKAKLLWAAVPIESRHVIMFARLIGWKSQGLEILSHGPCELFQSEL